MMQPPPVDPADLQRRFAASLTESGDLARRHGLDWFAKAFDAGRAALDGKPSEMVLYRALNEALIVAANACSP